MNRSADRPGSAENPVNLRPIDALRIRSRNRRKHGAAGRKTPKRSYHDSPPWMGSLARLLDFALEAPAYVPACRDGRALTNVQLVLGEVRPTPPVEFHAGEGGRERKTPSALMGMQTQRRNRVCAIFMGNRFDRRHSASLHIFACRPLVWSADYLDAMLRLSPRGEIAPPWRDINERTPSPVKGQCTRRGAPNDALGARSDEIESPLLRHARARRGHPRLSCWL